MLKNKLKNKAAARWTAVIAVAAVLSGCAGGVPRRSMPTSGPA